MMDMSEIFVSLARRPALWTALAVATLVSACATPGPDRQPLAQVGPEAVGLQPGVGSPAVPEQWWQSLGDEQLNALVELALKDHPSLAVARARAARGLALADLSRAASGPQAGLDLEVTRQRYSANGLIPEPIGGNYWNSGTLQATLSWEPDLFGRHDADLQAAQGQARAAEADSATARLALATQVARSYVGLARLIAQHEVTQRTLAQREEMLRLTRQRVDAGLDTQVELVQSEGGLPDARTQLEQLAEQILLARHQLAALTAQAPSALDALSPRLAGLSAQELPAQLNADLLGRRPDVVAARWRAEAATQDVSSARAQFYPNVNLSAFAGLSALGLDKFIDIGSRQMGVGPAIRLPLFDGGRLRAQLGTRRADLDAAIAQYNGAVLDAVREVGDALGSLPSLARQQQQQALAQASAERAYALALQRYRAGLSPYLVVLNTETQLLGQRHLAVDLQARRLDTQLQLMRSLGGGWQDARLTTPPQVALSAR
jgi:NodT family efflux transporter outer membrane factor (OMF) lipoprotein